MQFLRSEGFKISPEPFDDGVVLVVLAPVLGVLHPILDVDEWQATDDDFQLFRGEDGQQALRDYLVHLLLDHLQILFQVLLGFLIDHQFLVFFLVPILQQNLLPVLL